MELWGRQFGRFLIVGLLNTVLTLALFEILRRFVPYLFAYTVSYATGIVLSYVLNASFVFRQPKTVRTAALFPLVYVAQYVLGVCLMWLLVERVGLGPTVSVIIVIALSVPLTFFLTRMVLLLPRVQ